MGRFLTLIGITTMLSAFSSVKDYESLYFYAPYGMAKVSLDGVIEHSNPKLTDILGYSQVELRGKHFADITHHLDIMADREEFSLLVAGKIPFYQMEKRYVTKSDRIVAAKLKVVPRYSEDGSRIEHLWGYVWKLPIDNLAVKMEKDRSGNVVVRNDLSLKEFIKDNGGLFKVIKAIGIIALVFVFIGMVMGKNVVDNIKMVYDSFFAR